MDRWIGSILEKAGQFEKVIIVGAGLGGRRLLPYLMKDKSITVYAFFDNNDNFKGIEIDHIPVMKPYRIDGKSVLYIIAARTIEARAELLANLRSLRINDDQIVICYFDDYNYFRNLEEKYYEEEIQAMYYDKFGKRMNLHNPVTYNEKINWEKLHLRDERRTKLADKFLARSWVKEQIGEEHLTKLYGVWDDANEIDFAKLPNAFVLKVNNGSQRNIVVKDKSLIDEVDVCSKLNGWLKHNYAYESLEIHYRDIVPKIICEEYLEGVAENVYDYNIFCFHGEPEYVWCIKGSHSPTCRASFYNKDWKMMPFSVGYPKDNVLAPRPANLDEMLALSRILSKDFKHVRVDWYNLPDGRVLFGEMTFSMWTGLGRFEPEEYDAIFGEMI